MEENKPIFYNINSATIHTHNVPSNNVSVDMPDDSENFYAPLSFELPVYSIEDHIIERNNFLTGIRSDGDELGWFYFKVFFKFNTNYGLFGGVLKSKGNTLVNVNNGSSSTTGRRDTEQINDIYPSNSALGYLWAISNFYRAEKINDRILALHKFTGMLSDITKNSPWFFKGINGLGNVMGNYTAEFSKEKVIELLLNDERLDMRLGSLLNLYKYLCYDDINCKEILPENLRKFDMYIAVFHMPIKYLQTGLIFSGGALDGHNSTASKLNFLRYKTMHPEQNKFSNMFSFKLFTFSNCEFDIKTFGKYFEGSQVSNEKPFNLGTGMTLQIKFDRVYFHEMNEWNQFLFGSTGFHFNQYNDEFKGRFIRWPENYGLVNAEIENTNEYDKRKKLIINKKNSEILLDYTEAIIHDALRYVEVDANWHSEKLKEYNQNKIREKLGLTSTGNPRYLYFGNIYGKNILEYYRIKMERLKHGLIREGNIYGKDLGEQYKREKFGFLINGTVTGNIYGRIYSREGDESKRKNTKYLDKKIELLKGNVDLGNLYGNVNNPSFYFNKKMKRLKGNIVRGNLYGNLTLEGQSTGFKNRKRSRYLTKKLNRLIKTKNLGSIYDEHLSRDLNKFVKESSSISDKFFDTRLREEIPVRLKINEIRVAPGSVGPKNVVSTLDENIASPAQYNNPETSIQIKQSFNNAKSLGIKTAHGGESEALLNYFNSAPNVTQIHIHNKDN